MDEEKRARSAKRKAIVGVLLSVGTALVAFGVVPAAWLLPVVEVLGVL